MADKITREQFEELTDAAMWDIDEYNRLLAKYADITAVRYTDFSYFDHADNYLGDYTDCTTLDLLKAAYVEVSDSE